MTDLGVGGEPRVLPTLGAHPRRCIIPASILVAEATTVRAGLSAGGLRFVPLSTDVAFCSGKRVSGSVIALFLQRGASASNCDHPGISALKKARDHRNDREIAFSSFLNFQM